MEMMEGETMELRIKKGSGGEFGVKVSREVSFRGVGDSPCIQNS